MAHRLTGKNLDAPTVAGFGDEWTRFDQSRLSPAEREALFQQYFHLVDWAALPSDTQAFDVGCGSGRWALCVAPRVGTLHVVDASAAALSVARRTLRDQRNCVFHEASIDAMPIPAGSMDFGYSLGVLHCIPDPAAGVRACVERLKPGAPFLVYLYYALNNKPWWFRTLWRASDGLRRVVSRLPHGMRFVVSQIVAVVVYWPLARLAAVAERLGVNVQSFPLAFYRERSFYTMRTDALDRFGTRLERRFTRDEVHQLLTDAGLEAVRFSQKAPFWCAIGVRRRGILTRHLKSP